MINGVIAQKRQSIESVLTELNSPGKISANDLSSDWRTQKAVERNLQVLEDEMMAQYQRALNLKT